MSTITTTSKNKKQLVPQLRFKEFEGEWESSKLGDVAKIITGSTPSTSILEFYNGNYLFVSPADIQKNRYIYRTKTTLSKEGFEKCRKIKEGSVLFVCIGSTIGKVGQSNLECATNQQLNSLEAKHNYSNDYIFSLLEKYGKKIKLLAGVQAVPQINKTDFSNLKYHFPSLPEQQKIASFLTAVDDKIQQLTRKKELLQTYKKGVMQQLFSGQLRFRDENGQDYPKWEEKRLGDEIKYYDGTHQTPKYVEEGIPFYSVEHVTANQFKKTKYITKEVFEKENKRVKLEKGDILMTRIGDIGTSRLIDWNVEASFYVSLALLKQSDSFNSSFLNQYISSLNFQKELWAKTIHVAFPKKINLGEIGNCKIQLPKLKEQQKIADFLSGLDNKIEQVNQQITQTQTLKKGLLQQLFV